MTPPLTPCPAPPATHPGTSLINASSEPKTTSSPTCTTATTTPQPSCPEWIAPLQAVRQDSSDYPLSFRSPTIYHCLYPLCTGEFQDDTSLACHLKVHFEKIPEIERCYGRAEIELGHDEDASQCSAYDRSRYLSWATEQSSYGVALSSASESSDCSTRTTEDYQKFSPWEFSSGSGTGQQPTNTQDHYYGRDLNDNLAAQSPSDTLGNCIKSLNAALLHYSPTMFHVNAYSEKAVTCPLPACGLLFESFEHFQR